MIDASRLVWDQDRIYQRGRDSIRFVTGAISGHRSVQTGYQFLEGAVEARSRLGPKTLNGRFVEIVASSTKEVSAQTRAWSLWGLMALILGPASLGAIIFEADIQASRSDGFTATFFSTIDWHYNLSLPGNAFSPALSSLRFVIDYDRKAAVRALERYAQALSAQSTELKFSALFAGIDVICRDFAERHGGVPVIRERGDRHKAAFKDFLDDLGDQDLKSKILGSLYHCPIRACFEFYARENGLDTEESRMFKEINKRRNDLLHEGDAGDLHQLAETTKRLLHQMLQIELGIDPKFIWDRFQPFQLGFPIGFPNYGWGKGGDEDLRDMIETKERDASEVSANPQNPEHRPTDDRGVKEVSEEG